MKAITTKYHGPTNTRGSRISASDLDGNRVAISYNSADSSENAHRRAAVALCNKMKWIGKLAEGSLSNGFVYVFVDDAVILDLQKAHSSCVTEVTGAH